MMTQENEKVRKQMQIVCIDDLVPQDHLLRVIEKAIDWTFIYDLVRDRYSEETGRPSIDPVTLIKIPLIQYLYGIKSMRQTIKEIEVNMAYRWFLGLELYDPVPHFSTFGKNYTRRFKDTDLFEQIFRKLCTGNFRKSGIISYIVGYGRLSADYSLFEDHCMKSGARGIKPCAESRNSSAGNYNIIKLFRHKKHFLYIFS